MQAFHMNNFPPLLHMMTLLVDTVMYLQKNHWPFERAKQCTKLLPDLFVCTESKAINIILANPFLLHYV